MPQIPMSITTLGNALVLEFENENITAQSGPDTSLLNIYVNIKPTSISAPAIAAWKPYLLVLDGRLYAADQSADLGAPLRPFRLDWRGFTTLGQDTYPLDLTFELSPAYVRYLEQVRTKTQPRAGMGLKVKLWGQVAMSDVARGEVGTTIFSGIYTSSPEPTIRIARSDWADRILADLGYDQKLLIELPLPQHETAPGELKEAVQLLSQARQHITGEKYREAVQNCRQAKEALLKRNANSLKSLLEPLVGATKAAMVDNALTAFQEIYNAGSHPKTRPNQERVEISRDDAEFVVNSLAFILDYIARVLRTQSASEQ